MNGNASLIQAVRGPILLICLGTLMAIDHFGPYGFSRTWPVLIIVYGCLKLFERVGTRMRASSAPANPPGGNLP